MNVAIRKIGNSEGIIIPKEVLERMNLAAGDQLVLAETPTSLNLSKAEESFERQMEAGRKIMDRYKVALQKLAE